MRNVLERLSPGARVAVIRLRSLGDCVLTTPALQLLKQFRPDLAIDALRHNPHLWFLAFTPFVLFVMLVLVGSSNAVNLTDGLDGLAIGCTVIAAGALTVLTYLSGHAVLAECLERAGFRVRSARQGNFFLGWFFASRTGELPARLAA